MDTRIVTVDGVIFKNADNGYAVLSVSDAENGESFTAVGILPLCDVGDRLELSGEEKRHPRFGRQFAVNEYQKIAPSSEGAIIDYLASASVKGVGEALARLIVQHFGVNTLNVIENEPQRLLEVRGIGKKKCMMIVSSYMENKSIGDIVMTLRPYGVTVGQAYKLYKVYGELCLAKINEDPYQMIRDVEGIGFITADRIAQNVAGFEFDSMGRIRAGLAYALAESRDEYGHTYLPREKLLQKASALLGVDAERLDETIDWMADTQELTILHVGENEGVFLPYLAKIEEGIAYKLMQLAQDSLPNALWDIAANERELGLELSREQRCAVTEALNSGVMVITGGPGTGKTTIIRFIAHAADEQGQQVLLCAPTGRAAKRMTEATGIEAATIHRMLEYNPTQGFNRNAEYPLEADMIIVDEMSMVDAPLMAALLRAISRGTRLIMVGDMDQLPPVGCGDVLCDIINSETVTVFRLTEIFRQAQSSMIVRNAHRINEGESPILDRTDSDFVFEPQYSADMIIERVTRLTKSRSETLGTADPIMDVQILVPMKKGPLGVENLNVHLQNVMNPPDPAKRQFMRGFTLFREGDKIMQVKNNYKTEWSKGQGMSYYEGAGVFNGDLGTLLSIDESTHALTILFDDGRLCRYDFTQAEELELAYCISIHKSQGSEYNTVLLPLSGGPPQLLTRNLLYTAVTRAKKLVYCIGNAETLNRMVANSMRRRRYSSLKERLIEANA